MKIAVIRPDELGANELDLWRGFQRASPSLASPFLAPEFSVAAGRVRPRSRVAVLSEGAQIVGFFPFERTALGVGLPIAPGINNRQGMVHAPGLDWDPMELLRACRLTVWEFDNLTEGQLPFRTDRAARHPSPIMDFAGGFDAYWARVERGSALATNTAQSVSELPRKDRKISRQLGALRLDADCRDVEALWTLMSWKSAQYQRTGTYDRFARDWITTLVRDLFTTRTPTFSGVLHTLHAGSALVATAFYLRADQVMASWFSAYSRELGRNSPGLLLQWRGAEAAALSGIRLIDLGRGPEAYKLLFKTDDQFVFEGRVARRSAISTARWVKHTSVRRLRDVVVASPTLYRIADPVRRRIGRVDAALRRRP